MHLLLSLGDANVKYKQYSLLFLLAYTFLLRLPSEAIPVTALTGSKSLCMEGDELVLRLNRRKNRPRGSTLRRRCWCGESKATCPVHRLGPLLQNRRQGEPLFPGITAGMALVKLREMMEILREPRAGEYRTHDLRRGHAKDLQLSGMYYNSVISLSGCCMCVAGAPLYKILQAGEWRSPVFLSYLDMHRLETDAVVQAHIDESASDASDSD